MEPKNDVITTGVEFEVRKLTWVIENFDMVRKSEDFIKSQELTFQAGETVGLKSEWTIHMRERKVKEDNDITEWIAIFLSASKIPVDVTEVNAVLQLKIKGADANKNEAEYSGVGVGAGAAEDDVELEENIDGDEDADSEPEDEDGDYFYHNTGLRKFVRSKGWGCVHVIPKNAELEDLPLTNGSLVIEIQLTIYDKKSATHNDVDTIIKNFQPRFTRNLQMDLANLLEKPSSSSDAETKIVSKDEVKFAVNRGILSARSPVFEKMFQTDMKESRTGLVQIIELSSKTIAVLLRFVYTGTLHEDWSSLEVIAELVYAADKYQIRDLVEFLDHALGSICRKETAGKLFNLAKKLGMKKAERKLFGFMKKQMNNPADFTLYANGMNANGVI